MPIFVTLKQHLDNLKLSERLKSPGDRIKVPTISQLADDIGIERGTLSRTANNKFKSPSLDTLGRVIAALRQRGFDTDVSDVLRFVE